MGKSNKTMMLIVANFNWHRELVVYLGHYRYSSSSSDYISNEN